MNWREASLVRKKMKENMLDGVTLKAETAKDEKGAIDLRIFLSRKIFQKMNSTCHRLCNESLTGRFDAVYFLIPY